MRIVDHTSEQNRQIFHAAIAAGLVGEVAIARQLFQTFDAMPTNNVQWQIEFRAKNAALAAKLDEPSLFRDSVFRIIDRRQTREIVKLLRPENPASAEKRSLPT